MFDPNLTSLSRPSTAGEGRPASRCSRSELRDGKFDDLRFSEILFSLVFFVLYISFCIFSRTRIAEARAFAAEHFRSEQS